MQASNVKHYSEHFQDTRSVRRSTGDRSAVAESLRKYQCAKCWPNSAEPLPADLQRVLQTRKWINLEVTVCCIFLVVCFCGLVASLFGGPFLFRKDSSSHIPDFPAKAPLLTGACAAIFFIMFWVSLEILSRLCNTDAHVEALHFLYLYEVLPKHSTTPRTYREPVFKVRLEDRVYTMFANGETDVKEDSAD